jgi:acyl carrier protein
MTVVNAGIDRLQKSLAAVLGVSENELTDDASPDTVSSWDSLNHLNLIMALESEFGIELTPDDAMEMASVANIRAVLQRYGVEV